MILGGRLCSGNRAVFNTSHIDNRFSITPGNNLFFNYQLVQTNLVFYHSSKGMFPIPHVKVITNDVCIT